MKRRGRVKQILPVLPVCSNMNIDYQPPSQTGNSDRWHEVIYCGRRKNGKPDCRKARYFQGSESTDCLIELDRFQKTESVLGDLGELFEAISRIGNRERGTKIPAEIRQGRQPIHESWELRHIIRRDRTPPWASSIAPGGVKRAAYRDIPASEGQRLARMHPTSAPHSGRPGAIHRMFSARRHC